MSDQANLRPRMRSDVSSLVELSILAWQPVFESFREVLGSAIFLHLYPDWTSDQARAVEAQISSDSDVTWIAEIASSVVGFISWKCDHVLSTGEVEMLAVHPEYQRCGIGAQLNELALWWV